MSIVAGGHCRSNGSRPTIIGRSVGDLGNDLGACPRRAPNIQDAARDADTFAHASQTEPTVAVFLRVAIATGLES